MGQQKGISNTMFYVMFFTGMLFLLMESNDFIVLITTHVDCYRLQLTTSYVIMNFAGFLSGVKL